MTSITATETSTIEKVVRVYFPNGLVSKYRFISGEKIYEDIKNKTKRTITGIT